MPVEWNNANIAIFVEKLKASVNAVSRFTVDEDSDAHLTPIYLGLSGSEFHADVHLDAETAIALGRELIKAGLKGQSAHAIMQSLNTLVQDENDGN